MTTGPTPREDADLDTSRTHKPWCGALVYGCDCGREAALTRREPLDVAAVLGALETVAQWDPWAADWLARHPEYARLVAERG